MSYIKITKRFQDLSLEQLYQILQLRNEVFIVEQRCAYQDLDHLDEQCHHLMMYDEGRLIAYARIIPPGISYKEASIGRIVTHAHYRGKGVGAIMMKLILSDLEDLLGNRPVKIGAQLYAEKFYEKFGFVRSSEVYDEDGIEHIQMIKSF
ncbi:GNAT family N-acetyltransferase [Arcticibacter sp.]|jgi:ElaA protein|uniref:GNAT family N-acetyltransferase n=1 Tax=Arcticibacter sp. TaxID=1872630 RepID=UPI003890AB69